MKPERTITVATLRSKVLGPIRIAATEQGVCAVAYARWHDHLQLEPWQRAGFEIVVGRNDIIAACERWLRRYDQGKRGETPPLDLRYLPRFTEKVLQNTAKIDFGAALSYGELAKQSGCPKGARAIGQAMRRNPIPLIIPCHRVLAAQTRIGGFTPGLTLKRKLLAHEGVATATSGTGSRRKR